MQKSVLAMVLLLAVAGCAHEPREGDAAKGDARAQFELAKQYQAHGDIQEAVAWYQKAAMQASTGAQNNLGILYKQGDGVAQDYVEAFSWFKRAADMGNIDAEYNLAELYRYGFGTPQDFLKAAEWYGKAAMQGHTEAQDALSDMYYNGTGVTQNFKKAYTWAALAATSNADEAAQRRDRAASRLSQEDLFAAQKESSTLFEQVRTQEK
jgi:TPR repeat protein